MKKTLLKFFVEKDQPLYVKITCNEEYEGKEAPQINISQDCKVMVSVLGFEIDYEKSGKLWFNRLDFFFIADSEEKPNEGSIHIEVKNVKDFITVCIQPLYE